MKVNAGNLKKGDYIAYQNEIWQVQKTEFSFQGRGMAMIRTKLKNAVSGKNADITFKTAVMLEKAFVEAKEMQYLYSDSKDLYFMDEKSFDQVAFPTSLVGRLSRFLKEGERYYVLVCNDQPLNMKPPLSVRLRVVDTEDAVKGDTVSGAKKQAIIETGTAVMVPLFIKKGDLIVINPKTGEYVERAKA
ncbi:elongation factor P [Candidatus Roizmanbacteria bacterium]|nr:elongation factor P [Candidatus Roizmanbacteria bacterium]